jgi:anti-anti-sigma factor
MVCAVEDLPAALEGGCMSSGEVEHGASADGSATAALGRMTLRVIDRGTRRTLILSGELDLASRPVLDEALARVGQEPIEALVLDLSGVSFMDSTGLHAVLAAKDLCAKHGCELLFVRGSTQVQRLFELSGVLVQLEFCEAKTA